MFIQRRLFVNITITIVHVLCSFLYKEGPGDGVTIAKVYVLSFLQGLLLT